MTTISIKNMVCPRCIKVVEEELGKLNIGIERISLGEVVVKPDLKDLPMEKISEVLETNGFELLTDQKMKLIVKIKTEIISLIHNLEGDDLISINLSDYLSEKLFKDYHYLSTLFSKTVGITIEQFTILQKIERAKEYLRYNEHTLSEIAYKLGYSSVQHLSRQFKQVTGLTASQFKSDFNNLRKSIDAL